jgi:hypothetical protein
VRGSRSTGSPSGSSPAWPGSRARSVPLAPSFGWRSPGPLVSLALGGLFVLIALINRVPPAVDGVVSWLGYINLSLLVFT